MSTHNLGGLQSIMNTILTVPCNRCTFPSYQWYGILSTNDIKPCEYL